MSPSVPFVIAIDKDRSYVAALETAFKAEGYSYRHFDSYQVAQPWLLDPQCKSVVIARNLEGESGLQLARVLRTEYQTAQLIIILIAHSYDEYDVIESLEARVDDYMIKPLGSRELVCRFKAILRSKKVTDRQIEVSQNVVGALVLKNDNVSAFVDGHALKLTRSEVEVLQLLAKSPGRILSRAQLLKALSVGGANNINIGDDATRKIDVHIARIRLELLRFTNAPVIQTVRGQGYYISEVRSN